LFIHHQDNEVKAAIFREKQIKAGSCKKKIELIVSINPGRDDLIETNFK